MQPDDLSKQISFIKEIDKIKYIQRKTKLFNSDRPENDAEHSWHLAMMTIVLAEHADIPIDVLKVVKMVLIHDIVEIDAGDTFIYDTTKLKVSGVPFLRHKPLPLRVLPLKRGDHCPREFVHIIDFF